MADNSPKFPLVRCPKCGRLLPELPPYSVYRCGGCNGFLQAAHKNSPLRDNLSSNSSEGRFSGGIVGIDHDSERSTSTRVSNSPLRPKFGDPTRKSPVRETNTDGLNAPKNSPKLETVLGDFDVQSKSPLRETGYGHGKSPAISVRGGVEKAPILGSDDLEEQVDSEEDRVDSVDESYADWLHRESITDYDQIRVNRHSVLPRRLRRRRKAAQVGRRTDYSDEEYYKLYGRRGVKQPNDDLDDEDDHGVERRNIHRSLNYRTELLREYNELHEKLIRVGDLITYSKIGKKDQCYASTDCYGGPDDNVYDEFSGNRIRTVRSAGTKGSSRMRPHYVSEDSSLPQIHERTIHRQPPNNRQKFATQQPKDSSYDPIREYPHQRCSVDDKSDEGFSAHDHKKKALLVNQNGQICHPIVGGAPFVICPKCFQLLRLPGKLITTKKSQFRMQCGICHIILSLDFNKRRSEVACDSAVKPSIKDLLPLGPPLRDHKDHIYATKSSDKKESETSDQDKGIACRESFVKSCVGNAAVPTELEVGSSEIPKTDSSQCSADTSIRRDEGGRSEASEIHFASVIKGGFQDSSSPNLSTSFANADVSVNGMVINPNAVRKAEKMAGPISPGEYWYDSRAGFWGVMGDHCLGIIPPFIKEFSSQMAEYCSGGETCIYVNGRELHENDLDLLSDKGLPRTRYKYYVVDISGKVQDEDTGGFVVNLGKLAPTVESTGCGFGMHSTKAPKLDTKHRFTGNCNVSSEYDFQFLDGSEYIFFYYDLKILALHVLMWSKIDWESNPHY
ncbi:hypothetical protein V2J09_004855 [Rumex salicifolius]